MRLVLPSGEYPLDGVWDLSRVAIADVIAFETACGPRDDEDDERVTYLAALRGIGVLRIAVVVTLLAEPKADEPTWDGGGGIFVGEPKLAESLLWLIWVARHHAGDRQPNGAPLTLAELGETDLNDVRFVLEPGDRAAVDAAAEDPPDPQRPRRPGSGRGVPAKQNGKGKGRSTSRTSTGPS